jgi:NDP-sugar pyrophosphorylase family protein
LASAAIEPDAITVDEREDVPDGVVAASAPAAPPVPLVQDRSVHGIVLAGSFPWSGSPLDRVRPRPLLPVAHQPLISYVLRWLRQAGIGDVAVCLNRASRAASRVLDQARADLTEVEIVHDREPRGPAGCARDAALAGDGETFLVAEATAIPTVTLSELLQAHRRSGALATVVVHQEQPADADGCLTRPAGVYVFERRALEAVSVRGFQDIKENLIPRLYHAGEHVGAHVVTTGVARVLNMETYIAVNEWVVQGLLERSGALEDYVRAGEALVHRSAEVDPGARFAGPVLIGPGARIARGATVVGPSVFGADCRIESDAIVSRTVAWDRCAVAAHAVVDNCVLADDVIVETGARVGHEIRVPARRAEEVRRGLRSQAWNLGSGVLRPRRVTR